MWLYNQYELNTPSGNVGQAPAENIRVVNGVQYVEPKLAGGFLSALANMHIDVSAATSAGENTVKLIATMPPEGAAPNALQVLQEAAPGTIVMVNVSIGLGPANIEILVSDQTTEAVVGSDYAVLDVSKGVLKAEEQETLPLIVGAAAGGGVGFMTLGIPGAIGGAIGGYLLADWLT